MRSILLGLTLALVLSSVGCDSRPGPNEPTIPNIDEVRLDFSENGDAVQTVWARREEDGSFDSRGRLFLPPGQHDVVLRAYEEDESVTEYLVDGPDDPLLRFKFDEILEKRISFLGSDPNAAPLDTIYAPLTIPEARPTIPEPRPSFHLEVKDTTAATGELRLVLERYESFRAYRKGNAPLRIDFDVTISLRTLPSEEERELEGGTPSS